MSQRSNNKSRPVHLGARIPRELLARLRESAERNQRTVSGEVIVRLTKSLEQEAAA